MAAPGAGPGPSAGGAGAGAGLELQEVRLEVPGAEAAAGPAGASEAEDAGLLGDLSAAEAGVAGVALDGGEPGAGRGRGGRVRVYQLLGASAAAVALIALLVLGLQQVQGTMRDARNDLGGPGAGRGRAATVSKIAFGSCTSYDMRPQPVWTNGVIPSAPDAWIWAGDMAYMDDPTINCETNPESPQCQCESDFLQQNPHSCMAGDFDNAVKKMQGQLFLPEYNAFLDYMCPGHRLAGKFPPDGEDAAVCERPILGTYDDHDFGWNNGNKRLPNKGLMKQVFLDGLGVSVDSIRRNYERGIEWQHTLNAGTPQAVDVFLLDERYNRDTIACRTRRAFCEKVVFPRPGHSKTAWCEDFLRGGAGGRGSCCGKDEEFYFGWCREPAARRDPLWVEACDPAHAAFGRRNFRLRGGRLAPPDLDGGMDDSAAGSAFCEVLGRNQRHWLQEALGASTAPLQLIVSGSVLVADAVEVDCPYGARDTFGNPVKCVCDSDDFDCYRPAQINLMHTIANSSTCAVVLTGDHHYSDIRLVRNEAGHPYSDAYEAPRLRKPLVQVMASGLTNSTARGARSCADRPNPAGLRVGGDCAFTADTAFGFVDVDWESWTAKLQIRDGESADVLFEQRLDVKTCQPLD